jgi:hypothetical protein
VERRELREDASGREARTVRGAHGVRHGNRHDARGAGPFVRALLHTKDVGKGTGLGLATVHGIAVGNGGSVNVYSEIGRGSSFKVYFPRAKGDRVSVEVPAVLASPRSGPATVLVVEDAEGLRELTKRLLERQGYMVLVASNAVEARRKRLAERCARCWTGRLKSEGERIVVICHSRPLFPRIGAGSLHCISMEDLALSSARPHRR